MARYFFDTEFMEDGTVIELLSIGVVCEDGREFYAENVEADWGHANDWVRGNVLPYLNVKGAPVMTRQGIAAGLLEFVGRRFQLRASVHHPDRGGDGAERPEFWAYYGDYDWVVLCQLFGRMVDLPNGWPMFALDVKQLCVGLGDPPLPKQESGEHHALADARWTRDAHDFLVNRAKDFWANRPSDLRSLWE